MQTFLAKNSGPTFTFWLEFFPTILTILFSAQNIYKFFKCRYLIYKAHLFSYILDVFLFPFSSTNGDPRGSFRYQKACPFGQHPFTSIALRHTHVRLWNNKLFSLLLRSKPFCNHRRGARLLYRLFEEFSPRR